MPELAGALHQLLAQGWIGLDPVSGLVHHGEVLAGLGELGLTGFLVEFRGGTVVLPYALTVEAGRTEHVARLA